MAHESFENEDIARLINEYFIPIKVDREERPDIDHIYMTVVTALTGHGGWPLTVFLTPDKKPIFGGTYFPPFAKWGAPGLGDVLNSIHNEWKRDPAKLIQSSESIAEILQARKYSPAADKTLSKEVLEKAFHQFSQSYDPTHGGFGSAPKFPTSHNLSFLLRYWKRAKNPQALAIVETTLHKMADGGLYDHIGGGFHRYSTDREWQIPHFEKMLYDQAILARTYLEAYQATHNEFYAAIARAIFDYCITQMQDASGGFYSAEDADSTDPDDKEEGHKKEGAFYLWRQDEIENILGEDAKIFNYHFGVMPNGNAFSDPHGEFVGKNIIYVEHHLSETAEHFGKSTDEIQKIIELAQKKLFSIRAKRPRPHLDDKILSDWNGLMISSLAFGGKVLGESRYVEAAQKAMQFIEGKLMTKDGKLLHRYRDGDAAILGNLDDYAFVVYALLDLYEATFQWDYLKLADQLSRDMIDRFWDKEKGGFFFTAHDAEDLLFRAKEIYDGALPSGNSLAALNLIRLYHMTLQPEWQKKVDDLFKAFGQDIEGHPSAYAQMLIAFDFCLGPSQEIVIADARDTSSAEAMHKEIYKYFIPNKVVIFRPADEKSKDLFKLLPFITEQKPISGKTTAYVCKNHVCKQPVNEITEFRHILEKEK